MEEEFRCENCKKLLFKYGAGIILSIENLKLKHSNPDEIKFVIDYDNSIKEFDEENNVAVISFE